ncbi:MAG: hypothetical protein AAGB97_03105 [Dehalococcoidia bacterium]|nr:hypothetical protein [Chloroflexota bacterium]MBT9161074.1 hypothetical protein [Chloroflexota bacterium]MBT9162507.1 hypothetical protein [Chloroflexota bacterium]
MTQEKPKEKVITIDPKEVREGACHIRKWGEGKVSICKENGKIKIFEIEKEE